MLKALNICLALAFAVAVPLHAAKQERSAPVVAAADGPAMVHQASLTRP